MQADLFEALAPVCPRCLHGEGVEAPLTLAETVETRADAIWHGILHCSNTSCWMEFPVIDGVPVIVPDPPAFLAGARHHILARDDLPEVIEGLLGDASGPGTEADATRQHLSLYAGSHFSDWAGGAEVPDMVVAMRAGLEALGTGPEGPAIDLGGSVGRGGWELARTGRQVVVGDMNVSMLRLAQRLMIDGAVHFPQRRVGIVYDRVRIDLPGDAARSGLDFWAMDAMALPFRTGQFALASAINLVDCIPGPTAMIAEVARVLGSGGGALFTTPYDWSANATEPAQWLGGHSQRGPLEGASEPVLTATLAEAGLTPIAERHDLPWRLRMHARAQMTYVLHLVACRRAPL